MLPYWLLQQRPSFTVSKMQHDISRGTPPGDLELHIRDEVTSQHLQLVGSAWSPKLPQAHLSPLGVIPKKGRPNCWRLIMDLSSPHGHSINNGIAKNYASIDDAAERIMKLGKGAMLAKMDVLQAHQNIPVAPEDKHLMRLQWNGQIYVDQVLPFGLRSALIIFSAIVDAHLWIMQNKGVSWGIHYIDNFLTAGAPGSQECQQNTLIMQSVCEEAGLPMEPSKSVGPTTSIVFLGILINTVEEELRLPQDKLADLSP